MSVEEMNLENLQRKLCERIRVNMVAAPLNLIPIEKSCYHGSKSSGSQQTVVLQRWQ